MDAPLVERHHIAQPAIVYLLWLDYSVLDVYAHLADAYADAETFVRSSHDRWSPSRPGRWFGSRGRFMEIETREVKQHPFRPA